jgi:DNA-binding response OmpR family regulator
MALLTANGQADARRQLTPANGTRVEVPAAGRAVMARILVIDDEPGTVRLIQRALESEGHTIFAAHDGMAGLRLAGEQQPDLVVLDLLMPGMSGMGVLGALVAERPATRVVVISATDELQARVTCLDLGAADYLGKPFAISELLARVRSRLRDTSPAAKAKRELVCGSVRLDLRSRQVHTPLRSVRLSTREFAVMRHLMRRCGTVCDRAELLSEVWGYEFDPGSNVVDVTVGRLRAKVTDLPIETVRNVGYRLPAG